ncbi:MAG: succinylglutamate desuccinylase/aspartoacylase family protein [Verrucomicrobiae bacterium]|nr:succinylglutamate desuccinylase/aspartoacylase family protein [Verrucomicrobiae bacterium]
MAFQLKEYASGKEGPHLLITGGVHGDEFEPMTAIRSLIRHFDSDLRLQQGSLTLIPVVNEAAFLRGHRCAGEDNLDLARTCPGRPDGSVTERTAHALSELIRQADLYIDLHTGGTEFAVTPLAGYMMVSDPEILDRSRRMARAFNLPVIWGTTPDLDGRSMSIARDAGIPAIYTEYLGSATCSPDGTASNVDGCLNVMAEFGMIERDRPSSQVQHVIEDTRPGSGHMQVCHPSPIDGYFESRVTVGELVQKDQTLGQVVDLLGTVSHPILADQDGIIIMLRTFPRVLSGDSVGVVAPIDPQHS